MTFRMQRELLQQVQVTMLFATGIPRSVAGNHLQPAPKSLLILELARVADRRAASFLQGIASLVFISARDDEEELVKAIEVKLMKREEGVFIAGPDARREQGDVRGGIFRGNLGHNGGAIQGG